MVTFRSLLESTKVSINTELAKIVPPLSTLIAPLPTSKPPSCKAEMSNSAPNRFALSVDPTVTVPFVKVKTESAPNTSLAAVLSFPKAVSVAPTFSLPTVVPEPRTTSTPLVFQVPFTTSNLPVSAMVNVPSVTPSTVPKEPV